MPTYDFTCSACSSTFEASLPFGSKSKPACPSCGSKKAEKQITPPAIHFKGSGFFVTDSQKKAAPMKKLEKPASEPKKTEPNPTPPVPKTEEKKSRSGETS